MAHLSYDRYGLTGNPFRDLISESLPDVEAFHVNLEIDAAIQRIKEEVLDKENRAVVALVGAIGTGKTERLRLADSEARGRKGTPIYVNVTATAAETWKLIADELEKSLKLGGFAKIFSPPKWMRGIPALKSAGKRPLDPKAAARFIGEALNGQAPSFLLLNDLHNLRTQSESDRFAVFLQELSDVIRPGVLVMFGSYANFYTALSNTQPALASRVSRTFSLPTMSDDQAALLIAKKLLAKRIVEELDPLFPFDGEAVEVLNKAAFGNPRKILELADLALDQGVATRSYRVDAEVALAALDKRAKSAPTHVASAGTPANPPPKPAPTAPAKPLAAASPKPMPPPKVVPPRADYIED